jgi:hypothetical protein
MLNVIQVNISFFALFRLFLFLKRKSFKTKGALKQVSDRIRAYLVGRQYCEFDCDFSSGFLLDVLD